MEKKNKAFVKDKFKEILNSSPNPVIICDENHIIDTVNSKVCEEFGYKPQELIGQKIFQLIPVFQEGVENVKQAIQDFEGKFTAFKKNQDFLSVYLNLTDFEYQEHKYYVIWIYNIFPLSDVNKALKESEQRLNAVINTAVDGIITINVRGIIESINPAGAKLFGYEAQEVIGENISILMPEPYRNGHDGYLKNYEKTRKAKIIGIGREVVGEKKDGTIFPFNLSTSEVVLNERIIYTGIIHDITEQKEAKEKLHRLNLELENRVQERTKELASLVNQLEVTNQYLEEEVQERKQAQEESAKSQKLYTTISENFPNGVISVLDRKYNYVFINGKELKTIEIKNIVDTSIFNRFNKDKYPTLEEKLALTFQEQPQIFEMNVQDQQYIFYTVPLVDKEEEVEQILIVEKNVTELKKAEEEIHKSLRKEKQLNELKTRFVSMASHEFRTPLSTILSSSSLIARYQTTDTQPKRDKHIYRIQSAVKNLTTILNDFLSLDKLEQGKIQISESIFNLENFAKEIIGEIENMLKLGQHINYQHIGEKEIYLDQNIIRNICLNLLSNAIKYSGENTMVTFQTKIDNINKKGKIIVKDQGIGIPTEEQKHLFERFFRAQNVTNIQGTGLGLNIVKRYVDLLQGEIQFESSESQGTTFIITFNIQNHE